MDNERRKILQMLSEGKISSDDAERLLKRLDELHDAEAMSDPIPPIAPIPPTSGIPPDPPGPANSGKSVDPASDFGAEGLGGFIAKVIKSSLSMVGVAAQTQSRSTSAAHQAGSALRVRTGNGSVNVARSSGEQVSIRADIRAVSLERLEAVKIVATHNTGGTLDIRAEWPDGGPRGMEGCSFTIGIPDANGVDIETSNGSITVEYLGGEGVFRTRNGGIDVRTHGGIVRADTTNGKIRLTDVRGNIVAHGSNGRIGVERCLGSVDAQTTNGGIDLSQMPEGHGPLQLSTTNGSISAELGKAFRGALRMRTVNGHVDFNTPVGVRVVSRNRTAGEVVIGASADGPASSIKTTNGNVDVTLSSVEETVGASH
jgi:DUF4097 and DUF4098 domain-containing protein YvlB